MSLIAISRRLSAVIALKESMCGCTASCSAGYSDLDDEGCLNECSRLNVSKEGFILDVGCREGDVDGMLPFSSRRKNFSKKFRSIFTNPSGNRPRGRSPRPYDIGSFFLGLSVVRSHTSSVGLNSVVIFVPIASGVNLRRVGQSTVLLSFPT